MELQLNLPRKERERLARREEILNAARKVFSERGFEKATLDEIAVVAEYGKGTIYNYFKNKEELFSCIIEKGINRFQKFVEEAIRNKSTPREQVEAYIDAAFEFFETHRQIFSILELERNNLARCLNGEM
ncbi:MAG: TetR/AcrR family transcriptional regulator, partial [bacterium]